MGVILMRDKKLDGLCKNFESKPLYTIKDFSEDAGISLADAMEFLKENDIINNIGIKLEEDFIIESYEKSLRKFKDNGILKMVILAIYDTIDFLKNTLKQVQDYAEIIIKTLVKIFYFLTQMQFEKSLI